MNRSPITLRRINKLIGQAMRQLQINPCYVERVNLRAIVRRLNKARAAFKRGTDYNFWLAIAAKDLRDLNELRKAFPNVVCA